MRSNDVKPELVRCPWAGKHALAIEYHDKVWGRKPKDDRGYFQAFCIEIFEAGLNFKLVLGKLNHLRAQYKDFDPARVSRMKQADIEQILEDTDGIRSRAKAEAIIHNARVVLDLANEHDSFGKWVAKAAKLDKALVEKEFKKLFKFAGPTIVYEFLTSTGHWPTSHQAECFMYRAE